MGTTKTQLWFILEIRECVSILTHPEVSKVIFIEKKKKKKKSFQIVFLRDNVSLILTYVGTVKTPTIKTDWLVRLGAHIKLLDLLRNVHVLSFSTFSYRKEIFHHFREWWLKSS